MKYYAHKMKVTGLLVLLSLSATVLGSFGESVGQNYQFSNREEGLSTLPDDASPEILEEGPCHGIKCSKLFQMPVPPSCDCGCPNHVSQVCPQEKVFDQNLCECICRNINIHCPGESDFDFDTCECKCPLKEGDCGYGERLYTRECICASIPSRPTIPPPYTPHPQCPPQVEQECQGSDHVFDRKACKCQCIRFLVKKTTYSYYNNGWGSRSSHSDSSVGDDGSRSRRSEWGSQSRSSRYGWRSDGRSDSGKRGSTSSSNSRSSQGTSAEAPHYSMSCPEGRRVDHRACICYW